MKLIALAAVLALGGTAVAQTTTTTTTTTDQTEMPAPADRSVTPAPETDPVTTASTVPGAMGGPEEDPVGGYQPATPSMPAEVPAGATVVVSPSPSPSQAYPAPAPLKHYPLCKKGQFDNCRQRGG